MGLVKIGFLRFNLKTAVRHNHDRKLKEILPRYIIRNHDILDVGSGINGTYSKLFENINYETLDIDLEKRPTYVMDILQDTPNKKYDLVVAFNIFEHLAEPKIFLRNIKKLVRQDGTFIMSVPFIYPIHSEDDFYRYTEKGLAYLLGKYFEEFEIIPFGNPFISFLRGIAPIKYLGLMFNLTASFWESLFRYTDVKSPSGYFVICKGK